MIKFLLLLCSSVPVSYADPWYTVTYKEDLNHWMPLPPNSTQKILSRSYLASTTTQSLFSFPFYNTSRDKTMTSSPRDVITTTSSGFLYLSSFSAVPHTGVAGYIAPLMADFMPNPQNPPKISILALDNVFVVEWRDMQLNHDMDSESDQLHPSYQDGEPPAFFTFQCHLYPNGTILFLYQNIPVSLASLSSYNHPLEVGIKTATSPKIPQSPHVMNQLTLERVRLVSGVSVVISPNITRCCERDLELGSRRWCEMVMVGNSCSDHSGDDKTMNLSGEKGRNEKSSVDADKRNTLDSSRVIGEGSGQAGDDSNVMVVLLGVVTFAITLLITAMFMFYRYIIRGRREKITPFKGVVV